MAKKARWNRWAGLALATVMVLSACSSDDGTTETTAPAADGNGGGDSALSGTVRVWTHQNDSFNTGLKDLAAGFMADNPDVTIEFETFDYDTYIQTLQTALPSGTEADILQMFGTWTCSYADNLAAVPDSVATLDSAREAFFAAPLGGYTCDDTMYGFPQEFNIEYGAMLVNTDMAEAAGVADSWDTWDEFRADAVKMTEVVDGVVVRSGYNFTGSDGLPYSLFSLILQAGGQYMNDDGTAFTIDTPEGRQAMEVMMSFVDAGVVDPVLFNDEANWVGDCFFEGLCATGLVGPWVVPEYSGDFPEVAGVTEYRPLPTLAGDPVFAADSGWGLTVSANSKVQDAAWAFVEYVTLDEENAAAWNVASGTLPALKANATGTAKDGLVAEFPFFAAFFPLLEHGQYVGNMPDRDLVWYDITYPHVLAALQGVETIDEALAAIEQEANESFGG